MFYGLFYKILCMEMLILILVTFIVSTEAKAIDENGSYMKERRKILAAEDQLRVGGNIQLTPAEQNVNAILMQLKNQKIESSKNHDNPFPPHMHFFKAKPLIERSPVFQIIKKMPKGAALHLHDSSLVDLNWLVKTVTYWPNCYMCFDTNNILQFKFSNGPPPTTDCSWRTVRSFRQASGNVTAFDDTLRLNMSMEVDDPSSAYPTGNAAWKRFSDVFQTIGGLFQYAPAFVAYCYQALQSFYDDNVQYIEVRALLVPVYELDGSIHDKVWVMETYKNTTNRFLQDHPGFSGAKIIVSDFRWKSKVDILSSVKQAINLSKQFPNFMAGYDLVGQEDMGKTLLFYLQDLFQGPDDKLHYLFHAGETDWGGTDVGDNIIDAILLNTTRIGHGYALTKHPEAMKLVKQKRIAIEVNPISNQVLKLVDDLRNHPASVLLSEGFPVVISADDPAVWGAEGLSYDFYEVFMGIAGAKADLRMLKQLAMNSIIYSAMNEQEKTQALKLWNNKWNNFISQVLYANMADVG